MIYSQEVLDNAKRLNTRFTILRLIRVCDDNIVKISSISLSSAYDWYYLKKELIIILKIYDESGKIEITEKFIFHMKNINNIKFKRLIKLELIKIV